jgi:hypothetical protein
LWGKPFSRRRVRLVAEPIFLCGEEHTICNLVSLLSSVMQQVSFPTVRIDVFARLEQTLRKDVIYLRKKHMSTAVDRNDPQEPAKSAKRPSEYSWIRCPYCLLAQHLAHGPGSLTS